MPDEAVRAECIRDYLDAFRETRLLMRRPFTLPEGAVGLPVGLYNDAAGNLSETIRWLDVYFSGRDPGFLPKLRPVGTMFQHAVWEKLLQIPYGQTRTYGEISAMLTEWRRFPPVSARAIGGAVARNPVSLIIPCHRVVGADGSLTGYAGGIDRKVKLLSLENADMSALFVPRKGTAL